MAYLVLQMVDLVTVFSGTASSEDDGNRDVAKALELAQMVVGLAADVHYYVAVFHRTAAGATPRANWRVYAMYAACFAIVCACARREEQESYLAIYFATLALTTAATWLEPLRFVHAASPAAYAWTQAAQSLSFMAYLVLHMVDLVAVFSGTASPEDDDNGDIAKALGLAQMVVGLAAGVHYYDVVFHRAAIGAAPRAN
uniref:Uncharacterized protein n=1 Tax=Zea mays TaxID=4577 RepID=A0A804LNJ1_MAIZE